MNTQEKLIKKLEDLLNLSHNLLSNITVTKSQFNDGYVDSGGFIKFKTASQSFIINLYPNKHPFFTEFSRLCIRPTPHSVECGVGILEAIKDEIENGWLNTIKGIVSAEIFTDFIEAAEHLLEQDYKDPAAVMIGSVLEEHLRQLCYKNGIDTTVEKHGKQIPKRADLLNAELSKSFIYNKLDQKNIIAWLDLRNHAAHGNYSNYTKDQVKIMLNGVMDFIARNGI
ncbi:hypothetical protein [Formosa sp. L2A11]|uniref:hypothetical protein n=1 Tax=Formosa sp. L2A11 TaxID=2686363 RepID=UPI0018EEFE9A|nr:hypothetical protein [Formosa sp. L2A11]